LIQYVEYTAHFTRHSR